MEVKDVEFLSSLNRCSGKYDTDADIASAAQHLVEKIGVDDVVLYSDGSAEEGTKDKVPTRPRKRKKSSNEGLRSDMLII